MSDFSDVLHNLAPTGELRVAINYGNPVLAQRHASDNFPQGVSADLAREIARRLGVVPRFISYDAAGKVFEGLDTNTWDLAFLAVDPVRAEKIAFTKPYVLIEGTYLVAESAPFQSVVDLDQDGLRIAVGKGAAYDLYLSRELKHASIERAATSPAAITLFVDRNLDAAAGVRQPLEAYAQTHSGYRVLDDAFTTIQQAVAVPKGRDLAQAWLENFVAEMKRTGFIEEALQRSGQTAATVAPE
ncbi:MAG TPA: ABC transporter substrate-binding protein [Candidatus Paenalcaligenes intestinipullorum]|uniref:ABC transporter substrate-binding protein n=1 Tax=Candidatus Paenalcaligenes intestinipullorum TaxID=2838718 RepID=A0A9D2U7X6_9BURK|nr:ABC transporter substrate-binding protein [Candidatus Paenalcaligenes intestinipullorum]